jgi:hypothetical protein
VCVFYCNSINFGISTKHLKMKNCLKTTPNLCSFSQGFTASHKPGQVLQCLCASGLAGVQCTIACVSSGSVCLYYTWLGGMWWGAGRSTQRAPHPRPQAGPPPPPPPCNEPDFLPLVFVGRGGTVGGSKGLRPLIWLIDSNSYDTQGSVS